MDLLVLILQSVRIEIFIFKRSDDFFRSEIFRIWHLGFPSVIRAPAWHKGGHWAIFRFY